MLSSSPGLCSFIHSGHFYSASYSPLLLRSATDTARILCRSFTPKRHRQLLVEDLPKVPKWWQERESNPRPSGRKASTLPMHHHVPRVHCLHSSRCPFFSLPQIVILVFKLKLKNYLLQQEINNIITSYKMNNNEILCNRSQGKANSLHKT